MTTSEAVEILLVEDSDADAELAIRALRRKKLANRLHHCRDGAEALEFLHGQSHSPRVVLLDLKLPKIDGLEVLERLRSDPRTKHLPVVVLTSSREDRDLERAYALGANSYIVKPVDFDKFVTVVGAIGFYWVVSNEPPKKPEP